MTLGSTGIRITSLSPYSSGNFFRPAIRDVFKAGREEAFPPFTADIFPLGCLFTPEGPVALVLPAVFFRPAFAMGVAGIFLRTTEGEEIFVAEAGDFLPVPPLTDIFPVLFGREGFSSVVVDLAGAFDEAFSLFASGMVPPVFFVLASSAGFAFFEEAGFFVATRFFGAVGFLAADLFIWEGFFMVQALFYQTGESGINP
jgi:hypothetical protein